MPKILEPTQSLYLLHALICEIAENMLSSAAADTDSQIVALAAACAHSKKNASNQLLISQRILNQLLNQGIISQ